METNPNDDNFRSRLRDGPGVAPEDTRAEMLQQKGVPSSEEDQKMLEKEDRKSAEVEAMRQEREARARAWTLEQAQAQVTRDVFDHEALALFGKRGASDAFYLRDDMAENAKASAFYDKALSDAAPELYARVQSNGEANVSVDVASNLAASRAAAAKSKASGAEEAQSDLVQLGLNQQLEADMHRRKVREQEQSGLGLNAVDVQRSGKELERGEFIVPRRITQTYTEVDGKFFAKDSNRVMFEDKGEKLATSTTDKPAIADMVAYAKAKQWEALKLSGSQDFRREAWLQAESQGIKTQGYTPKQSDLAALNTLRQERSTNSITPLQERRAERPVTAESREAAAPRHDLNKNQAVMHVEASKNVTTNLEVLRKQPGMLDKSVEDLTRLAYLRGILSEENKLQPKPVRDEAMARFDKQAIDPQFLKRISQETEPKIQDKTTERVQRRDTLEQSI